MALTLLSSSPQQIPKVRTRATDETSGETKSHGRVAPIPMGNKRADRSQEDPTRDLNRARSEPDEDTRAAAGPIAEALARSFTAVAESLTGRIAYRCLRSGPDASKCLSEGRWRG